MTSSEFTERASAMSAIEYDEDFYGWTQQQARLIRLVPRMCRRVPPNLDLINLAEEIEDLGKSQLSSVQSHARNALTHIVKAVSDPECPAVNHWRKETRVFLLEMRSRFSPSMRQKLDMDAVWQDALDVAADDLKVHDAQLLDSLPDTCPFELDELLAREFTHDGACEKLAQITRGLIW